MSNVFKFKTNVKVNPVKKDVEKALTDAGFISKQMPKYTLWKVSGGDLIWIRMFNDKLEVYPISDWDAYKSNTIHFKDINLDQNIFLTLLKNKK